ncbi:MAG TPA: peptide chain release factor N(5)-glutamine methyltransferase, partial [Bacteroidia bacterium]|nr:peptide chain release factor N(5)-glutamine methyltransferase [Bacteroidia bacterium]
IVSNPPYIPQADEATLHSRVRDHEPPQALFSPTEDPLLYYRVIAGRASRWLVPGGWLIFEIHSGTGSETEDLLKTAGLVDTSHLRDLNGNERIVLGRLPDDVAGPGK